MTRRYRAPAANRAVLAEPEFGAIPGLIEANRELLDRAAVVIGGLPLRELRALARREVLELTGGQALPDRSLSAPLLLTGHQPELSHPGVWVKNFALNGLARKVGGIPLNLVVDNDTLKSTSLRLPALHNSDPSSVHLDSVAFDAPGREEPYEHRTVNDVELFRTFADRAALMFADWGYEPLLPRVWKRMLRSGAGRANIGQLFAGVRCECEREWGCDNLELSVSRLAQTESFARFVWHILSGLPRFREIYNAAVRAYREANGIRSQNHPAPELAEGEAPFWVYAGTPRSPRNKLFVTHGRPDFPYRIGNLPLDLTPLPGKLDDFARYVPKYVAIRPRALTLTLFARVCLGDFFIHGIGGGKYDEVTDSIIRGYFGIEPPAYQVLSATLHLPLPGFPSTPGDLHAAERRVRDLRWNPQRHLTTEQLGNPEVKALLGAHAALAASEPPYAAHAARRDWFRGLCAIVERLRPLVAELIPVAESDCDRVRSEVHANAILKRRDYAWVLYPEEVLRPFLQGFAES